MLHTMQNTLALFLFAGLSIALALFAWYLVVRQRRMLAKHARLKKYLVKLKDAERTLRKNAFLDPLTGLANRLAVAGSTEITLWSLPVQPDSARAVTVAV